MYKMLVFLSTPHGIKVCRVDIHLAIYVLFYGVRMSYDVVYV